jgi:hypothetical protein
MTRLPIAVAAAALLALAGCASPQPHSGAGIRKSYPLGVSDRDEGALVYRAPDLQVGNYTRGFFLDPVTIYSGSDAEFSGLDEGRRRELAQNLLDEFRKALSEKYLIAPAPGPGVIRLRLTLVDVAISRPALSTALRLTPFGFAMTLGRQAAGLPGAMTGSVTFAGEIFDGGDGRLLGAFLTKQSPPALDITAGLGDLRAAQLGMRQGAESFRAAIDRLAGR